MNKGYRDFGGHPSQGIYMPLVPIMPIYPILARAYVPYQVYKGQFTLEEALDKGTLYPELYRSYIKRNKSDKGKAEGGLDNGTV